MKTESTGGGRGRSKGRQGMMDVVSHPDSVSPWDSQIDIVIVGAGGWGLASLFSFNQLGMKVVSLEKGGQVGGAFNTWARRYPVWASLHSQFRYLTLADFWDKEWGDRRPTFPELIAYYRAFAKEHRLVDLIRFGSLLTSVSGSAGNFRCIFLCDSCVCM